MSTKDDASLDHPSNGQSMVVHQSAPLGAKDIDWGPVTAYSQGHEQSQADPTVYLHAIRRHWFPALLLGVILAGSATVGTWFALPKNFTSTSLIQVDMMDPSLVFEKRTSNVLQEYEIFKATQSQLVRSPLVLTAALRKPEIASLSIYKREEDPIGWLQDELQVFFPGDSEIMHVALTADKQDEVMIVVQAVVDAYLKEIVERKRNTKARELAEIEGVLASKEREVRQRRTTLKTLAEELGTADKDAVRMQLQFATQQLGTSRSQLARIQMDRRVIEAELAVAEKALKRLEKSPANSLEVERLKLQDPVCRELQKKLSELQMLLQQSAGRAVAGGRDRLADQLYEQANGLNAELENRLAYLSNIMTEATRSELLEQVDDLRVKVRLAGEAEEELQKQIDDQRAEFEKLGQSSVELEMMRTDLVNLEAVVSDISLKHQSLEVENNARRRIDLLQKAEKPAQYDNFQLNATLSVLAGIFGLAIPMVIFVWMDVRRQCVNSSKDVAKGLGVPVMGSVPMIPSRAIKQLNAPGKKNQQWNVRLAESIDSIAAKLLRNANIDENRVVLITSAVSGEGKTTLATQVAMSLARAGKNTVLVDFDLRRPAIDKAFQLPLYPGVSEALCGENDIATLPQPTGLAGLDVVTAGRCDRHALQSLASGGDKELFENLRQKYDFVIVDGSPILPVADSRYVSQHVDSVVLSVFRDFSRTPKVAAACEILEAFGVADIEAVVTSSSEGGYGTVDPVAHEAPASA